MDGPLASFKILYEILKDRPDLFATALILMYAISERSERKTQQTKNDELIDKLHEQTKDSNELLITIKVLLEVLTRGRK